MNHDEHYEKRRKDGVETIDIIERLMVHNIPEEYHRQVLMNYNVAQAFKYMDRLGSKDEAEKELAKAENYLHRARTAEWKPK
jgi:hypothetical protein